MSATPPNCSCYGVDGHADGCAYVRWQREHSFAAPSGSASREQRLYDALKRITRYEQPKRIKKTAERDYGVSGDEAVEMAYENVLSEAAAAIHGMRRPKS